MNMNHKPRTTVLPKVNSELVVGAVGGVGVGLLAAWLVFGVFDVPWTVPALAAVVGLVVWFVRRREAGDH